MGKKRWVKSNYNSLPKQLLTVILVIYIKLVILDITISTDELHWITVSGVVPVDVLPMSEML